MESTAMVLGPGFFSGETQELWSEAAGPGVGEFKKIRKTRVVERLFLMPAKRLWEDEH